MGSHEIIPAVDLGGNAGPPVIIYPNKIEIDLSGDERAHIDLWSQGHSVSECGEMLGTGTYEANEMLSAAKKRYGARNRRQMLTMAIQNGSVGINVNPNPSLPTLSRGQDTILHLLALGWSPPEIQARLNISDSSIDSHSRFAKIKLEAKNIPHLIRRSFEENIFKVGEPLVDPYAEEDTANSLLRVSVEDTLLSAREIGLSSPHDFEIIRILGGLGIGYFDGGIMSRNNFAPNAASQERRLKLYREVAIRVQRKLNEAFDKTVLDFLAISSNYRYYFVTTEMAIGTPDDMKTIMPVGIDELPKPGSSRRGSSIKQPSKSHKSGIIAVERTPIKRPRRPRALKPAAEVDLTPIAIENPYLDRDSLPDLDQVLQAGLTLRPAAEVLTNQEARQALREIMHSRLAPAEYRDKLVMALRYGMPLAAPLLINRRGQSVRLEEVMKQIPPHQGIDVASVSQVTGLKFEAVLLTELAFLRKRVSQFPALNTLIVLVVDELAELRKQTD